MAAVKPTRRERARATRERIVEAGCALFEEHGYGVTMEAIAIAAGVAVQTVYFVFHTKGGLLRAVVDYAAAGGHGGPPPMERPWIRAALADADPARVLATIVSGGTDLRSRVAALDTAIQAASATDPELAGYWDAVAAQRKGGIRTVVQHLHDLGALREGLTVDRATDVFAAVHNPAVYRALVIQSGWAVGEYKAWLTDLLTRELLKAK